MFLYYAKISHQHKTDTSLEVLKNLKNVKVASAFLPELLKYASESQKFFHEFHEVLFPIYEGPKRPHY